MGEIISRPNGGIVVKRRYNTSTRQEAIIMPPVRVDDYVPVGPPTGKRKSKGSALTPTVEILNSNPGVWYKVALGKSASIDQIKMRMLAMDNTLKFDKSKEDGSDQWGLYASAPDIY